MVLTLLRPSFKYFHCKTVRHGQAQWNSIYGFLLVKIGICLNNIKLLAYCNNFLQSGLTIYFQISPWTISWLYLCNITRTTRNQQLTTTNKTEVESVQLGNTYIADMDRCPQDKCCLDKCHGDSCNLLYMFPGPFV